MNCVTDSTEFCAKIPHCSESGAVAGTVPDCHSGRRGPSNGLRRFFFQTELRDPCPYSTRTVCTPARWPPIEYAPGAKPEKGCWLRRHTSQVTSMLRR